MTTYHETVPNPERTVQKNATIVKEMATCPETVPTPGRTAQKAEANATIARRMVTCPENVPSLKGSETHLQQAVVVNLEVVLGVKKQAT